MKTLTRIARHCMKTLIPALLGLSLCLTGGLVVGADAPPPAESDVPAIAPLGLDGPQATKPTAPKALRGTNLPTEVPVSWWNVVQADLVQRAYQIRREARSAFPGTALTYQAPNRTHKLRTQFTPEGIQITPGDTSAWRWGLSLTGYGREGAVQPVVPAERVVKDNRIEYRRPDLTEWYVNDARGLEQGFTLERPPAGTAHEATSLELAFALTGDLAPRLAPNGESLAFDRADGETVLHFGALYAFDATGRALPTRFALETERLAILVDARQARYPITVDPLATSPDWTAESDHEAAFFGVSVAGAGDVNGDGYEDVIVGAPYWYDSHLDEGRAYVYHGSAWGLEATPAWTADGEKRKAHFGNSVAAAGDVNGDGYDDVIVGAPAYDNPTTDEGKVWVYHGSAGGLAATPAWTAEGDNWSAFFGKSIASAGDVNGDGYDDIIVGAWYYTNDQKVEGQVFVYHGSEHGLSALADWTADGDQSYSRFGWSVSGAVDVNADGYDDVIVGAPFYSNGQSKEGRVVVYHGSPTGLPTTASWMVESDRESTDLGWSVAGAGDVNGDGYGDILAGSIYYIGAIAWGRVDLYLGSDGGLSALPDWTVEGDQASGGFGRSLAGAGDVNRDGYDDIIVGAYLYDNGEPNEGRAYVYEGDATGLAVLPAWWAESDWADAAYGYSVAGAGDVNGNGYTDVIVGAYRYDNPELAEGRAFVYHGGVSVDGTGHITGGVTNDLGDPLSNIDVAAYFWNESRWVWAGPILTDENGYYDFGGLTTGTYSVCFADCSGQYLTECYDDTPEMHSSTDIVVTEGMITAGIDAQLALAGQITGRVTDSDNNPLMSISVTAYAWNGSERDSISAATSDAEGHYTISGLPTGTYWVCFHDDTGKFLYECHDDAPDVTSATDVAVTAGMITVGIDAPLPGVPLLVADTDGDGIPDDLDPDDDNDDIPDERDNAPLTPVADSCLENEVLIAGVTYTSDENLLCEAGISITTENQVIASSGATVIYRAAQVGLGPGFTVQAGAMLRVQLPAAPAPCELL